MLLFASKRQIPLLGRASHSTIIGATQSTGLHWPSYARTLTMLGGISLLQGNLPQAEAQLHESGHREPEAMELITIGCALGVAGEPGYAAQVCSAAESLLERLGTGVPLVYRPLMTTTLLRRPSASRQGDLAGMVDTRRLTSSRAGDGTCPGWLSAGTLLVIRESAHRHTGWSLQPFALPLAVLFQLRCVSEGRRCPGFASVALPFSLERSNF